MALFDYPNVNIVHKTNEENIQSLKGYLTTLSDDLNYQITKLESKIDALEKQMNELKGDS